MFAGGVRIHHKNDTDQKIKLTSAAKYPTTVYLDPGMTGSVAGQAVTGTDIYVKVDYLREDKSVLMWGKNWKSGAQALASARSLARTGTATRSTNHATSQKTARNFRSRVTATATGARSSPSTSQPVQLSAPIGLT